VNPDSVTSVSDLVANLTALFEGKANKNAIRAELARFQFNPKYSRVNRAVLADCL
jgi:hypothetical protein